MFSKDIIQRWTCPLVPDISTGNGALRHSLSRHNVYKQPQVTLSRYVSTRLDLLYYIVISYPNRGCVLEIDVVIGEGTLVGEKAFVTHSVIGKHCTVGKEVVISNAYVWDNVVIKVRSNWLEKLIFHLKSLANFFLQDKCRIDLAIIANDVVIEEGVELGRGCIIGPGAKLSSGTKVPPNTRLVANPQQENDDFGSSDDDGSLKYSHFAIRF